MRLQSLTRIWIRIRIGLAIWVRIRFEIKKNWIRIHIETNGYPLLTLDYDRPVYFELFPTIEPYFFVLDWYEGVNVQADEGPVLPAVRVQPA